MIVCDTPESIDVFRLLALRGMLKLESMGMKHSRVNVYMAVKREFGLKGSKKRVLAQFEDLLREKGVLR